MLHLACYHRNQLIKGMYSVFLKRWQREHRRLLPLRAEDYYARPKVLHPLHCTPCSPRTPYTLERYPRSAY